MDREAAERAAATRERNAACARDYPIREASRWCARPPLASKWRPN